MSEKEIDRVLGIGVEGGTSMAIPLDEASYFKEAVVALRLAKEVIKVQQSWRKNAVMAMNKKGGISRSLANSATDWPWLLLEL
ncbi:hypothetical protein QQ045_025734 [Rhodiola kirilowii]